MFRIGKLTQFAVKAIQDFAATHSNETFYAFAVDASLLCLNSEEGAASILRDHQDRWDRTTRHLSSIDEMTDEDWSLAKIPLEIAEKHRGLARGDDQACLEVINSMREKIRLKECTYRTDDGIASLRENTGDWKYQGFADLSGNGFDERLYDKHYEKAMYAEDGHAPHTRYAKAMNKLIAELQSISAFDCLKRTPDFRAYWVDHDY